MLRVIVDLLSRVVNWLLQPQILILIFLLGGIAFTIHHYWDIVSAPALFKSFVTKTIPAWGAVLAEVVPRLMLRAFAKRWIRALLFVPAWWLLDAEEKQVVLNSKEAAVVAFKHHTLERPATWWNGKSERQQTIITAIALTAILVLVSLPFVATKEDMIWTVAVFLAWPIFKWLWRGVKFVFLTLGPKILSGTFAGLIENKLLPGLWNKAPEHIRKSRPVRVALLKKRQAKRVILKVANQKRELLRKPIVAIKNHRVTKKGTEETLLSQRQ